MSVVYSAFPNTSTFINVQNTVNAVKIHTSFVDWNAKRCQQHTMDTGY